MRVRVRYAVLDPARIVNLTSPRYLPEVSLAWEGRHDWHDARYEPVRDLMERLYVDGFNAVAGHFERLEASVLAEGFRNPVVLVAGGVQRRKWREIPPEFRTGDVIVSEYLGGSRLWVAQRHGLPVPAIVNDLAGVLPDADVLRTAADVRARFRDPPRSLRLGPAGVRTGGLPYVHLPPVQRYSAAKQSRIRRELVARDRKSVV